ncbi:unnamed protein product, partial [Symbiodinium sp. KB8]
MEVERPDQQAEDMDKVLEVDDSVDQAANKDELMEVECSEEQTQSKDDLMEVEGSEEPAKSKDELMEVGGSEEQAETRDEELEVLPSEVQAAETLDEVPGSPDLAAESHELVAKASSFELGVVGGTSGEGDLSGDSDQGLRSRLRTFLDQRRQQKEKFRDLGLIEAQDVDQEELRRALLELLESKRLEKLALMLSRRQRLQELLQRKQEELATSGALPERQAGEEESAQRQRLREFLQTRQLAPPVPREPSEQANAEEPILTAEKLSKSVQPEPPCVEEQ